MASIFFVEGSSSDSDDDNEKVRREEEDAMDLELPMQMPLPPSVRPLKRSKGKGKKKSSETASSTTAAAAAAVATEKKKVAIPKEVVKVLTSYVDRTQGLLVDKDEKSWNQKPPLSMPSIYSSQEDVTPKIAREAIAIGQIVSGGPDMATDKGNKPPVPLGVSVMDPRMLSDKEEHIGVALQNQLNTMAAKKILATDRKTLETKGKMPIDSMFKGLFEDFVEICKQTTKQMLNSSTTADAMLIEGEEGDIECPLLSRTYLVDFLRAPVPALYERPCSFGTKCQSHTLFEYYKKKTGDGRVEAGPQFLSKQKSFELREFLLPHQQSERVELVRLRDAETVKETLLRMDPLPCLLCSRYMTSHLSTHFCMQYDDVSSGGTEPRIVQSHGNYFSREGEYQPEAMLQRGNGFSGLISPIVEFDRDHYLPFYHRIPSTRDPIVGWVESDAIIFRLNPGSAITYPVSALPLGDVRASSASLLFI